MLTGRKIITLLISVLAAILLWLYVVTVVAPEASTRVSGIHINIDGAPILEERSLVITEVDVDTITLDISTSRANLSKLNADTIRVNADATRIREPGTYDLTCTVTFPDTIRSSDVDLLRKSVEEVHVTVTRLVHSSVPVTLDWTGAVRDGYIFEEGHTIKEPAEIQIYGPEEEVSRIKSAVVSYDVSDLVETTIVTVPVTFLDENEEEISFSDMTSANASQVSLTLPVFRTREITLGLELLEGGGVTEKNANIELEPKTILVKGAADVIDQLEDPLIIGSLDLATVADEDEQTFNLTLPAGVSSISGEEEVKASIRITGVKTDFVAVSDIRLENAPQGLKTDVSTKTVRVTIRGSTAEILEIKNKSDNGLYILVDLSAYNQTGTFPVVGKVINPKYPNVSTVDSVDIVVMITIPEASQDTTD